MRFGVAVLLLAALSPLTSARAADCANAVTQMDLDSCAGQAFRNSDKVLNETYTRIMQRLNDDPAKQHLLATAQRAWVKFRDAACAFSASGVAGGSMYPMVVTQCRDSLTKERVEALRRYLRCEEGDPACPVPPARPQ